MCWLNVKDLTWQQMITIFTVLSAEEKKWIGKLIAGTDGYICNECIELCHSMLEDSGEIETPSELTVEEKLPTPHEIRAHLDDYVIGQD